MDDGNSDGELLRKRNSVNAVYAFHEIEAVRCDFRSIAYFNRSLSFRIVAHGVAFGIRI